MENQNIINEIQNRVENFNKELLPLIYQCNEQGVAWVSSLVTPTDEEGTNQCICGISGKKLNIFKAIKGLDGQDAGNIIREYAKFKSAMELKTLKARVKDLLDELDKEGEQTEDTTGTEEE